jgi:hypothetical protein
MISFESLLERDYLYWLDYAPDIEWFEAQPLQIDYQHESRSCHYIPDFHLVQAGRHVLVECKPDQFASQTQNHPKFKAACDWCRQQDWDFLLVTDQQLRAGFGLQNVKLLTRYARYPVDPGLQSQVYQELYAAQAPLPLAHLVNALAPEESTTVTPSLLAMLFRHDLAADLAEAPLSQQTLISWPQPGQKGSH